MCIIILQAHEQIIYEPQYFSPSLIKKEAEFKFERENQEVNQHTQEHTRTFYWQENLHFQATISRPAKAQTIYTRLLFKYCIDVGCYK